MHSNLPYLNHLILSPMMHEYYIICCDNKDIFFFRILNKLTPEKFDKLSLELLNVGIGSQVILKGIILLVSTGSTCF